MKIIDVIPIAKGIPKKIFSYFTSKDVSAGALVSVPVRKKGYPRPSSGQCRTPKNQKISLKDSSFTMKPIKSVISANFITPEFFRSLQRNSRVLLLYDRLRDKDFVQAILEGDYGPRMSKIV